MSHFLFILRLIRERRWKFLRFTVRATFYGLTHWWCKKCREYKGPSRNRICYVCGAENLIKALFEEDSMELPVCDTTMTRRASTSFCGGCETYEGNLGPCDTWEAGPNERCSYCDHKVGCHIAAGVSAPLSLDGILVSDLTEEHTWPTYGGITRSAAPANAFLNSVPNWTPSDAGNITLAKLQEAFDKVKHLQPNKAFPPYYRCHPATYQNAAKYLCNKPERPDWLPDWINFSGIKIVPDPAVPLGEFWPPEGWKADE